MPQTENDIKLINALPEIQNSSYDPARPVGVVIADAEGHVLSTGTNKPPTRLRLSVSETHAAISNDPAWKYFMLEHAERNAIIDAIRQGHSLEGATLYGTLYPCADCARVIVASGIVRVVVPFPEKGSGRDERWQEHYRYAQRIFELAGVKVEDFRGVETGSSLAD